MAANLRSTAVRSWPQSLEVSSHDQTPTMPGTHRSGGDPWRSMTPPNGRSCSCPCCRPTGSGRAPSSPSRLGVSARTLRRDVDRLRALGYPVDATPGASGGYRLGGGRAPPAPRARRRRGGRHRGRAARRRRRVDRRHGGHRARVRWSSSSRCSRTACAGGCAPCTRTSCRSSGAAAPTVDAEALAVLALGCRDHEQVRFDYRRRDGDETSRLVEPHQLVSTGRRWYLVAWDVRRDDWRTFRLDRLERARDSRACAARRAELPGGDAAAFVAESIRTMPMPYSALLDVDARRRRGARRAPLERRRGRGARRRAIARPRREREHRRAAPRRHDARRLVRGRRA